ncbi:hypothetical protein VU08_08815 [Desulfobulbus sp. F5]|nr:hypothetical protein [Desulfobulbus sp. F5]
MRRDDFSNYLKTEILYNQNRLNDFNHSNVKVVATHVGLDVGEDGPTHQCIDYLGLMKNYFRFSVFMPADPNQTARIIRHIATHADNHFVGMGRSKTPTITREDGSVFYDAEYVVTPGKADWLRKGTDAAIITYGAVTPACMEAWALLKKAGIGPIVTAEDHHRDTGLDASVATVLIDKGLAPKMKRLGVKQYGGSGKPSDLYKQQGLDAESIAKTVLELLG